jgi:hypothetical protein
MGKIEPFGCALKDNFFTLPLYLIAVPHVGAVKGTVYGTNRADLSRGLVCTSRSAVT